MTRRDHKSCGAYYICQVCGCKLVAHMNFLWTVAKPFSFPVWLYLFIAKKKKRKAYVRQRPEIISQSFLDFPGCQFRKFPKEIKVNTKAKKGFTFRNTINLRWKIAVTLINWFIFLFSERTCETRSTSC